MVNVQRLFNDAVAALNNRKLLEAERLFREVLTIDKKHVASLNLLTIVLMTMERFREAEEFISRAVRLNQSSDVSFYNYGLIAKRLNKPHEALDHFDKALRLRKTIPETWNNRGTILNELMRYEDAIADFDQAIALNPSYSESYVNKATALFELRRYDEAGAAYDKALALKPGLAEAWLGRGSISIQRKRFDDALADFDKALALKPDLTAASLGRGRAFAYTKRYDEALAAYEKTLALKPDLADAWLGRGNVFTELERYEEALAAYDKALTLKPRLENAWLGRGNVYAALKRYDEAFAAYDEALALKPDLANAWLGRGNVFTSLERYDDALSAYDEALVLKPDLENAWLGLGNLCSSLKRYDKALAAYDKALELKPDFEAAWFGRGNILTDLRRHEDAFIAYDRAFVLDPDLKAVEGARLHAKMQCCDWRNFDKESKSLIASTKNKNPAALPWVLLSISTNPQEQLEYAKVWALKNNPAFPSPIWQGEIYKNKKIRVGYVSSDFRSHAVAYLLAGVFESHDRRRFEIFALSTGHDDKSAMRDRLKSAFDEFTDVSDKSDRDIADQIRALNIDILVDLMGYTSDMRLGILTQRPAPVQVAYLGYAGTTGATFVDYLIADRTVIPLSHQMHYVEKIAYLPHCFLPHDVMGRQISDKPLIRSDFGLPERGCVFCCFNNTYKLNPDAFQSWMTIMKATDGSVLWLSELQESAQNNLRKEARAAGVDAGRLVFAKRLASVAEHLARHQLADLFLDTTPYNAHTTASDALWAGLPVLTEIGETFAARVAASLLTDVGLTELIARSRTEYQKLAIELANDPARLAKIKDKLRAGRVTSPLFNTQLFTRHLEGAYEAMYRRYQAGLAPDHITVEDKEESEPGPRDELAAGELLMNEVG